MNPAGAMAGTYYDNLNGIIHGFLRSPNGTFTTFDPPNNIYTFGPYFINPAGAITGIFQDATYQYRGFLRTPDGTLITVDPSDSTYTQPVGINPAGTIAGYYYQVVNYSPARGFLRAPNGAFTTFDYPGTNQGTIPSGITPAGTITGSYYANGQYHGFLRTRKGNFTTFDYPGTPGSTYPFAINPTGEIAGYYTDSSGNQQCFLRIPAHPDE
jgi:hypothetical protein